MQCIEIYTYWPLMEIVRSLSKSNVILWNSNYLSLGNGFENTGSIDQHPVPLCLWRWEQRAFLLFQLLRRALHLSLYILDIDGLQISFTVHDMSLVTEGFRNRCDDLLLCSLIFSNRAGNSLLSVWIGRGGWHSFTFTCQVLQRITCTLVAMSRYQWWKG